MSRQMELWVMRGGFHAFKNSLDYNSKRIWSLQFVEPVGSFRIFTKWSYCHHKMATSETGATTRCWLVPNSASPYDRGSCFICPNQDLLDFITKVMVTLAPTLWNRLPEEMWTLKIFRRQSQASQFVWEFEGQISFKGARSESWGLLFHFWF